MMKEFPAESMCSAGIMKGSLQVNLVLAVFIAAQPASKIHAVTGILKRIELKVQIYNIRERGVYLKLKNLIVLKQVFELLIGWPDVGKVSRLFLATKQNQNEARIN